MCLASRATSGCAACLPTPLARPRVSTKRLISLRASSSSFRIKPPPALVSARGSFTLFANRGSAEAMRDNQLRIYRSAMAYVLVCGLRRLGFEMRPSWPAHKQPRLVCGC